MKKVWILHIQSESSQNYYKLFKNKPTQKQILQFQKEMYIQEYQEEPEYEYFTDLMSERALEQVKYEL